MREKLKDHIETLFAAAPDTESARNLKDEVLQNTLDRYDDARAAGAAEEAAWAEAVEALDGLEAVIRDLGGEPAPADRRGKEPDDAGRSPAVDTLIPAGGCRLRGRVASLDVRYGFGTVAVR
ncbi:MAG: hypothetical protein IJL69_03860, partial [Oscillospiraceae bacterium]|nr:hypothetical protein [Oscillospiraceae bacterium]